MRRKALVPVLAILLLGCDSSPQKVNMLNGSFKSVANGRATIWFGMIEDQWQPDTAAMATAAMIKITCKEDDVQLNVVQEKPSEEYCGIRVRLVEVTDMSPPRATFEITWE